MVSMDSRTHKANTNQYYGSVSDPDVDIALTCGANILSCLGKSDQALKKIKIKK